MAQKVFYHQIRTSGLIDNWNDIDMKTLMVKELDNLIKGTLDGLQGLCYPDDSCVVSLQAEKQLDCAGDCHGRTIVSWSKYAFGCFGSHSH